MRLHGADRGLSEINSTTPFGVGTFTVVEKITGFTELGRLAAGLATPGTVAGIVG